MNSAGTPLWVTPSADCQFPQSFGIAVDSGGAAYTTGSFADPNTADGLFGNQILAANGNGNDELTLTLNGPGIAILRAVLDGGAGFDTAVASDFVHVITFTGESRTLGTRGGGRPSARGPSGAASLRPRDTVGETAPPRGTGPSRNLAPPV